jgi:hypothetical protein
VTKKERENRNPAPEVTQLDRSSLREASIADLVKYKVYILCGNRRAASLNYIGVLKDPGTGETCYHFHGPRVPLDIFLQQAPGVANAGKFADGEGNLVAVYEYEGEDA